MERGKFLNSEFLVVGAENVLLGENPLWLSEKNRVCYLDIIGKKLISTTLDGSGQDIEELNEETGSVALCSDGSLIFAATSGVFDQNQNLICPLKRQDGIRFNDGKASPDGRYFVGTIEKSGGGKLFCLENGELNVILESVKISNGLDWSIDGKAMYYCDTATGKIVCFSYPDFKEKKIVIDFNQIPGFEGVPDGLCIDLEGNLWVAVWGGGCVVRVDAQTGEIIKKVKLPAKFISCPAFVGNELNKLFVTSAKNGGDSDFAGRCFVFDANVKGRAPFKVDIQHKFKKEV